MSKRQPDKKPHLDPTEDGLRYLQQLFDAHDPKKRIDLSKDFEDEIITRILSTDEGMRSQEIGKEHGQALLEALSNTLACVRTLADYADGENKSELGHEDGREHDGDIMDSPTLSLDDAYINDWEPGKQLKIISFPKEVLFDLLVEEAFLSENNKELFEAIMKPGHLDLAVPVKVNWLGNILSLVNFVVLGYYLHLFKIYRKVPPNSKGSVRSRPVFEAAIRKTFLVRGKEIYEGITKIHIEPLEKEISKFLIAMRINYKMPAKQSGCREDLPELLGAFFDKENVVWIEETMKKLDPDVGKLLSNLLESAD